MDYLKYDWCTAAKVYQPSEMPVVYKKMYDALARTGRSIVYSLCQYGMERVWEWGASVGGNLNASPVASLPPVCESMP